MPARGDLDQIPDTAPGETSAGSGPGEDSPRRGAPGAEQREEVRPGWWGAGATDSGWRGGEPADARLDPRAWLVWAAGATVPVTLGRNPFVVLTTLAAVAGVRVAWAGAGQDRWGGLVRLAAIFALVGAMFNLLTAPAGGQVLVAVPGGVPLLGDALTWNALAYGLLAGVALLTLVMVGATLGVTMDWPHLLRLLPGSLSTFALAGSIAWTLVPGTEAALRDIREAQRVRGYRPRGGRGFGPLVVPLVAGGLERAWTLGEALEARGFGAVSARSRAGEWWRTGAVVVALTAALSGAYAVSSGEWVPALAAVPVVAALVWAVSRPGTGEVRPTRYRLTVWTWREGVVVASGIVALAGTAVTRWVVPAGLTYDPYPDLGWPVVSLPLLLAVACLLAPAFIVPLGTADPEVGR